ncbi:hypothetical protein [Novipirellula caenicola]|uniref:Uncharacterized protein n=1 Tax=Novipirellula caenicola TaxID=1536901 RepID=A0ABP9VZG7_9BACT
MACNPKEEEKAAIMELRKQRYVERIRALAQNSDSHVDLNQQDNLDNGLAAALDFMSQKLAEPNASDTLSHDLTAILELVVPEFSDACKIDLFDKSSCIRRFAKYASDELLLDNNATVVRERADHPTRIKIALSDGISFLGAIEFQRLPHRGPFTMDEHLDAKVLASRVSKRIVRMSHARFSGASYRN